jgi:hypothetical protein
MWYSDTAPTEIYDVYWDSLGTVAKVGTNVMLWSSTLADTMITDSLTLGANVVRSGSIIDATIQNADLDSASVSLRCMAAASVDSSQIKSNAVIEAKIKSDAVTATKIKADAVTEAKLKAVNSAADEDILTYETTTGDFEWATPAELAIPTLTATATTIKLHRGQRLFPFKRVGDEDRFYVAGIDSADVVLVSWAPRTLGNMPYATGTGTRMITIGGACVKADTIYVSVYSGLVYSAGDSCYNWIALDVD